MNTCWAYCCLYSQLQEPVLLNGYFHVGSEIEIEIKNKITPSNTQQMPIQSGLSMK